MHLAEKQVAHEGALYEFLGEMSFAVFQGVVEVKAFHFDDPAGAVWLDGLFLAVLALGGLFHFFRETRRVDRGIESLQLTLVLRIELRYIIRKPVGQFFVVF